MPAFAADYFSAKNVGPIYGLMLTAWACQRFRPASDRQHAPGERHISWRASRDRCGHAALGDPADSGVTAEKYDNAAGQECSVRFHGPIARVAMR